MVIRVNPEQARKLIEAGSVEVIDVREPGEWARGHIPDARLLELAALRADPRVSLPRDGVLFVCAGGVRSQTAARIAIERGGHARLQPHRRHVVVDEGRAPACERAQRRGLIRPAAFAEQKSVYYNRRR